MKESCRILLEGKSAELMEKKSRFIATLRPVHTEAEAAAFIEEMKKKYWDASHNCYAWILGDDVSTMRCSDDGEPAQTAGRPMLDVLLGEKIYDVCVVVTRYFGGTLLGTGGLVRAYQGAVREGLKASQVIVKQLGKRLEIVTDYNGIGRIRYLLAQREITTLDTVYEDRVTVTVLLPASMAEALRAELTEATGGRAVITEAGELHYGLLGKKVLIL